MNQPRFFSVSLFLIFCLGLWAKPLAKTVFIRNVADTALIDQPVIIKASRLCTAGEKRYPAVKDTRGNWVASQIDDIDGDGKWDELALLVSVPVRETARFDVVWVTKKDYPKFKRRSNIRFGKMTTPGKVIELTKDAHGKTDLKGTFGYPYQMDGVAWENDRMGFRHYFDGRNCRDLYGKKTTDLVLDSVGIKPNGYPGDTYHVMADWGRDILSVGQSFGLGGLALMQNDTLVRLGVLADKNCDVIDSTRYTLINKGVVRGIFRLDFEGWNIGKTKISLSQLVTIWGGSFGYENEVVCAGLPAGCSFVTGIVHNNNNQPFWDGAFYGQKVMITHDKQSYNKEFTIGMCLLIPQNSFAGLFDSPSKSRIIPYTWCAQLRPGADNRIKYSVLASWEKQNPAFMNRDYFVKVMKYEALKRSNPFKLTVK